jgi:membrane associated rhomboid family serine protease
MLAGLIFPQLANPRMGLSGHLVGLFGGLFLLALGGNR